MFHLAKKAACSDVPFRLCCLLPLLLCAGFMKFGPRAGCSKHAYVLQICMLQQVCALSPVKMNISYCE